MSLKPFVQMIKRHQLVTSLRVNALYKPYYKAVYLAAAGSSGLLEMLASGPRSLDAIAATFGDDAKSRDALEAWLRLGVTLRLLRRGRDGYRLRGLAARLARPENDATLALLQEAASLHHKLILDTPAKLCAGEFWQLDDQDGELTTRSSRALEPFLIETIDRVFVQRGPVRLLEIGCGSGIYIRHAARRNPALHAVGLELQPQVADVARAHMREWGLDERVDIEACDIRERTPVPEFDYVTLHNNIYYFPVDERVALLRHVRGFLRPGGVVLLTTCCQDGNPGMEVLSLWGAATANAGRLPLPDELARQFGEAGYDRVETTRLIPGDALYAFRAGAG